MRRVWITRTQPSAEMTAARVRELGLRPIISPLLDVVGLDAEPPQAGEDVAFTSANGVRQYFGPVSGTAWCVGEATARAARAIGFSDVRVGGGDVAALTKLCIAACERPLVHWAGAHVRGSLSGDMVRAGRQARRVVAYRAEAVTDGPTIEVEAVLFHSPRAAGVFRDAVRESGLEMGMICVSISEATDAELATIPNLVRYIAERPDEDAMMRALAKACELPAI